MKKILMTLAAVLCCAMTAITFTACGDDDDTNYPATYKYDVVVTDEFFNSEQYSEDKSVETAFKHAIGGDVSYYEMLKSPKDTEMKAACETVKNQYANTVQFPYLKLGLVRTTATAEPGKVEKNDTIATYELGKALTTAYVTYYYASNKDEAFEALAAMKDSLGNEVYRERYQTLAYLIGSKSISSPFEMALGKYIKKHLPDTEANTRAITHICDSIAQAHESDVLAVDATALVGKVGLFDAPSNAVIVWGKTFRAK
jgi:hypothetical protein